MASRALTKQEKIALVTQACWLAGLSAEALCRALHRAGATPFDLVEAISICRANDTAMARVFVNCANRGAEWDRRRA